MPLVSFGNQEAISKMCPSHVTPQPEGLAILSVRIQSKCPNTAATVCGDLWGHSCRPTSQPSLQTHAISCPSVLNSTLCRRASRPISQTGKSVAPRSHICSLRSLNIKEQAWKHSSAPGGLEMDSILPGKDHRESSTEPMASEAREGTANRAEQCVAAVLS